MLRGPLQATVVLLLATLAYAESLAVATSTDVLNWHPGRTRSAADSALLDNVYERLVDFGPNGDPIPALALSWVWLETDRWVFELRPGVRFSNGEPFDAHVVKRNLELQRDDIRAGSRTWLEDIRAIEVADALTVHLLTYGPEPELPHALAWAGRMVPPAYGIDGDAYSERLLQAPVGTGPYRVVAWSRGQGLRLEANPAWWGPAPEFREVDVRVIPDASDRVAALLVGEVQLIDEPALGALAALRAAGGVRVQLLPDQRLVYVLMDSFRVAGGASPEGSPGIAPGAPNPLRDHRVRRALYQAIDRAALAADVHHGTVTPAWQPSLPGSLAFHPAFEPPPYDPAAARAGLAEAGYPDGFEVGVVALVGTIPMAEETLRFVTDAWAAIGVRSTLEVLPFPVAARRYSQLEVSIGMASWGGLTAPHKAWTGMMGADPVSGYFGSQNVGRYDGRELNAVLDRLRSEVGDDARRALYREAAEVFAADVPILPLYVTRAVWAMRDDLCIEARGIGVLGFRDVRTAVR